jgi:hypothetical protein
MEPFETRASALCIQTLSSQFRDEYVVYIYLPLISSCTVIGMQCALPLLYLRALCLQSFRCGFLESPGCGVYSLRASPIRRKCFVEFPVLTSTSSKNPALFLFCCGSQQGESFVYLLLRIHFRGQGFALPASFGEKSISTSRSPPRAQSSSSTTTTHPRFDLRVKALVRFHLTLVYSSSVSSFKTSNPNPRSSSRCVPSPSSLALVLLSA